MYKYIFSILVIPVLFLAIATPVMAAGQGVTYQAYNQTSSQQQIAHLYSLIAQLQAQLAALQGRNQVYPPYNYGESQSSNEISKVVTGTVTSDGDDAVNLEGEITFRRDSESRVWFEYGSNTKLSYSTESLEIGGDGGNTEDFAISVSDLDNNKVYYYRAVAEDENGRYVEGTVRSFRFDGRNNSNQNYNNNDWNLEVENNYYETGDTVRVDYEVGDDDNNNWIGLYEVGDRDSSYISSKYVRDNEGYVTFRINRDGEYEFRLFDNDNDKQAESDSFEVAD